MDEEKLLAIARKRLKKKNLNLVLVDYGLAFRSHSDVVINENMFKYPVYLLQVLDHEIRHTGKFSLKDFIMDLSEGSFFQNTKFCLRHPKGFLHLIPFTPYKGNLLVDVNLILNYVILGLMIGGFNWLI